MANKIADFVAQIVVKVDFHKLIDLEDKLTDLKRAFHNLDVDAKKSSKSVTQSIGKAVAEANKHIGRQRVELEKSTEDFWKRAEVGKKAAEISNRYLKKVANQAKLTEKYTKQALSVGDEYKGKSGFSRLSQVEDQVKRRLSFVGAEKARVEAQQAKIREEIDKAHAKALKEDKRREEAAKRLARIRENNEKRLQAIAKRTEAIREAGARKAAAILQAAEVRRQAVARTAGRVGRPSSAFSGASFGGAIGAGASSVAGFLPGFGGAYAAMNFNKIGQELQQLENALLAVSGSEQAAAQNLAFLNEIGAEMGKTVRGLGPEFVKLKASIQGTALDGQEQGIFRSFMKYGTVMGLDEEAMKGSFRAVSQMVSKQQVYAEELRGQLTQ